MRKIVFLITALCCGGAVFADYVRNNFGSQSVFDAKSKVLEKSNLNGFTVWRSEPVAVEDGTAYEGNMTLQVLDRVPGAIASVRLLMLNEDKRVMEGVSETLDGYQVMYSLGGHSIVRTSKPDHRAKYMCLEVRLAGNPIKVQIVYPEIKVAVKKERFKGLYDPKAAYPDRTKVLKALEKVKPATARVERRNGRTVAVLDGKEAILKSYKGSIDYKAFGDSGMNLLFSFNAGITLWWDKMTWDMATFKDGKFDFTRLENELLMMHDAAPNARVLLNVDVDGGPDFYTRYPDSIFRNEKGELGIRKFMGFGGFGGPGPDPAKHRHYAISYSSEDYQNYVCNGLRELVRFLKTTPAGKIVAGFGFNGGHDGQFFQWEYNSWRGQADYSPAAIKAYRKWLKTKYKNDKELQKAWQNPNVTLAEAPMYTEKEWQSRRFWSMNKSGLDRKIADGREFISVSMADMNNRFARTLKEEMGRDIIVGTYYSSPMWSQAARSHMHKLGENKGIDAVFQVSNYHFYRNVGSFGASANFAIASAHSAGLIFCQELDHRTHRSQEAGFYDLDRAKSVDELKHQLFRDAGSALAYGADGFYHYDMYDSWYHDDGIQNQVIRVLYNAADFVQENRHAVPRTQAALFLDEKDRLMAMEPSKGHAGLDRICRISGITPDIYLLEDLTRDIPDYKLWIISDPRTITPEQLSALKAKAFRKGNVVIITGSAGAFQNPEAGRAKSTLGKLGIKVKDRLNIVSDFTDFLPGVKDKLMDKCTGRPGLLHVNFDKNGVLVYPEFRFSTVLNDNSFKVLGVWNASKEPALGVKRTSLGTIVYSSHPAGVSAQLIHNCAKEAGITPHSEVGNAVHVGNGVIAAHRLDKEMVLTFDREMEFFDPDTKKKIGQGKTFKADCGLKESRLINYRPVK